MVTRSALGAVGALRHAVMVDALSAFAASGAAGRSTPQGDAGLPMRSPLAG
jgi:hypothetical protein